MIPIPGALNRSPLSQTEPADATNRLVGATQIPEQPALLSNERHSNTRDTEAHGRGTHSQRNSLPLDHVQSSPYFDELHRWADNASKGERRKQAVRVTKAWVLRGNTDLELNYSKLGLCELPPLPQGVKHIVAAKNRLTALPEWADSVESVRAPDNNIKAVHSLPPGLTYLDLSSNCLEHFPHQLPTKLMYLNLYQNQLSALPKDLAGLNAYAVVNVMLNQLPETERAAIVELTSANDYSGPTIQLR